MTTKSGILALKEKQRIEELIKCTRERKRLHIVKKLDEERCRISKAYDDRIQELQVESEKIRCEREKIIVEAGYGKIHERGCYDTHPDLDKFDAETNQILIRLWKTAEPDEKQFQEE